MLPLSPQSNSLFIYLAVCSILSLLSFVSFVRLCARRNRPTAAACGRIAGRRKGREGESRCTAASRTACGVCPAPCATADGGRERDSEGQGDGCAARRPTRRGGLRWPSVQRRRTEGGANDSGRVNGRGTHWDARLHGKQHNSAAAHQLAMSAATVDIELLEHGSAKGSDQMDTPHKHTQADIIAPPSPLHCGAVAPASAAALHPLSRVSVSRSMRQSPPQDDSDDEDEDGEENLGSDLREPKVKDALTYGSAQARTRSDGEAATAGRHTHAVHSAHCFLLSGFSRCSASASRLHMSCSAPSCSSTPFWLSPRGPKVSGTLRHRSGQPATPVPSARRPCPPGGSGAGEAAACAAKKCADGVG